jgi:hypothetical protein
MQRAALVLETNNLGGGGADRARIVATVERLLAHLGVQRRPLASLDEVVITHDGALEGAQARLEKAARAPLRLVALPRGTDYYQAKNRGFYATHAEVVAFGDADCWPDAGWLEQLLAPFSDENVQAVAGRTSYRDDLLGIAATTIDFMYFASPLGAGCTRNFYANNVAFRRAVFASRRFAAADEIYRGQCQVLGLRLQAEGVPVRFVPTARTVHRFPDSVRELLRLRLLRGRDAGELTPHLARAYLPARLRWAGALGPASTLAVLAVRLGCSLGAINRQDMPLLRGPRQLACAALVAALSAVDAVGALGRVRPRGRAVDEVLSYHGDGDRLTASPPPPPANGPARARSAP